MYFRQVHLHPFPFLFKFSSDVTHDYLGVALNFHKFDSQLEGHFEACYDGLILSLIVGSPEFQPQGTTQLFLVCSYEQNSGSSILLRK